MGRSLSSLLQDKLLDMTPFIYPSTPTISYFLCPNRGNLRRAVIKMVNTANMTVMMNVALSDEA
jgi:hypothetical protein